MQLWTYLFAAFLAGGWEGRGTGEVGVYELRNVGWGDGGERASRRPHSELAKFAC